MPPRRPAPCARQRPSIDPVARCPCLPPESPLRGATHRVHSATADGLLDLTRAAAQRAGLAVPLSTALALGAEVGRSFLPVSRRFVAGRHLTCLHVPLSLRSTAAPIESRAGGRGAGTPLITAAVPAPRKPGRANRMP